MNYIQIAILLLFISIGGLKAQFTTITYQKNVEESKNKTENFQQYVEQKAESKEKRERKKKKNKKELRKEIDSLNTVIYVYHTMTGTIPNPKEEEKNKGNKILNLNDEALE